MRKDNHSVIVHPIWMIKTLFDIDYLAQYEPYHISRKRGKVREMEYKRKVDKNAFQLAILWALILRQSIWSGW